MIERLEQAVDQLKKLPKDQQNAIAAQILKEIEDKQRWEAAYSRSKKALIKQNLDEEE